MPHNYVDLSDNLVFQIMLVSRREVDLLPTSAVNFSDKLVNIIIWQVDLIIWQVDLIIWQVDLIIWQVDILLLSRLVR